MFTPRIFSHSSRGAASAALYRWAISFGQLKSLLSLKSRLFDRNSLFASDSTPSMRFASHVVIHLLGLWLRLLLLLSHSMSPAFGVRRIPEHAVRTIGAVSVWPKT